MRGWLAQRASPNNPCWALKAGCWGRRFCGCCMFYKALGLPWLIDKCGIHNMFSTTSPLFAESYSRNPNDWQIPKLLCESTNLNCIQKLGMLGHSFGYVLPQDAMYTIRLVSFSALIQFWQSGDIRLGGRLGALLGSTSTSKQNIQMHAKNQSVSGLL